MREQALEEIKKRIKNKNLLKHMLATEACMKELAKNFNEDQDIWALSGLVHDIDYEETKDTPEKHATLGAEILKSLGYDKKITDAVLAHAGKKTPENKLEWALYAVDPLTGLIVASALMHPEKKLWSIDVNFILRRFKEKRFAAGANREQIKKCSEIGLSLNEFISICLKAMQSISKELGL